MILTYSTHHRAELLELLKANTPRYFHIDERTDFLTYLQEEVEDYFVYTIDETIIGSGGINYFKDEDKARLSWDIIHPDFHGRGIGSQLVNHRIQFIQNQGIKTIEVRTSQLVYKFYEKLGFNIIKTEADYWGEGFDLFHLKYKN